jgi:hypothetical protein
VSGSKVITKNPPPKPKPEVDSDALEFIASLTQEDSHVYVHCYFDNPYTDALIRIWKTTFLIDNDSAFKSSLIHAEKISFAPQWTLIPDGITYSFLLIFSALPTFDFIEEINQPGGFTVRNIPRNETDVYHITLI